MKHSAVIYVHGVGNPERHVSLSQFIDHIDHFGEYQARDDLGKARTFETKLERLENEIIHYVDFHRVVYTGKRPKAKQRIRVYEAYWAPESQVRFGLMDIIQWIIARLMTPLKILFSSWRSYSSFRVNELHTFSLSTSHPGRIEKLEGFYRDFQHKGSRKNYPKGRFKDFLSFLAEVSHPRDKANLHDTATDWRKFVRRKNAATFVTLLAILMIYIWIVVLTLLCAKLLINDLQEPSSDIPSLCKHAIGTLVGAVVFVQSLVAIRRYLFDVMAWTLSSERDRRFRARRNIVQFTQGLIRHVVSNDECTDCIIVGHSLGTSIAIESLLKEGESAKLDKDQPYIEQLSKVRTFYAVGSPIDLIFNMFQSNRIFSHRFNRIREDTRLSVGLPPFHLGARPGNTEFVNFWSPFDPISSVISSIRKRFSERNDAIINVKSLPPGFPFPVQAHTSYFGDPMVIGSIYNDVMGGSRSLVPRVAEPPRWFGPPLNLTFFVILLAFLTMGLLSARLIWSALGVVLLSVLWAVLRSRVARAYQASVGSYLKP